MNENRMNKITNWGQFTKLLVVMVIGVSIITTPNLVLSQDNQQVQSSNRIISVAKNVIRQAAIIGIEEAGTRIMGSAWPVFKKIVTPVFEKLQNRYPNFFLLEKQPGEEARKVAEKAIAALSADPNLQKMITDSFSKLESGQERILKEIDRLEDILFVLGQTFEDFEHQSERRHHEIMEALDQIRTQRNSNKPITVNEHIAQKLSYEVNLDIAILLKKGKRFYKEGNHLAAINSFSQVITKGTNIYDAYLMRGMSYHASREYRLAIDDYVKAINLNPTLPYAYDNIGKVYTMLGIYDEAVSYLNKAIVLSPNLADAFYERGVAFVYKEEYELAITDFNRFLKFYPLALDGLYYRGYAYRMLERRQEAINDFKKILSLSNTAEDERDMISIRDARRQLRYLGIVIE